MLRKVNRKTDLVMRLLGKFFIDHPASVDETYLQHYSKALSFSLRLLGAGIACLIHALVPGLFVRTGSTMIEQLYEEMVTERCAAQKLKKPAGDLPASVV